MVPIDGNIQTGEPFGLPTSGTGGGVVGGTFGGERVSLAVQPKIIIAGGGREMAKFRFVIIRVGGPEVGWGLLLAVLIALVGVCPAESQALLAIGKTRLGEFGCATKFDDACAVAPVLLASEVAEHGWGGEVVNLFTGGPLQMPRKASTCCLICLKSHYFTQVFSSSSNLKNQRKHYDDRFKDLNSIRMKHLFFL